MMIQSVSRAVRILFELQGARRLPLSELAHRVMLPSSTVHGLVRTLAMDGMIEQDSSGQYMLGPRVLGLGNAFLDSNEFRLRSLSAAEALSERTGHAVRVAVLLGSDVVVVHHVLRPDGSRQMRELGIAIPAHATALGKVLLAFQPNLDVLLPEDVPLRRLTGRTVAVREVLRASLEQVRQDGMAYELDEVVLGESEVAAAIFDARGTAVGAVSVVLPTPEEAHGSADPGPAIFGVTVMSAVREAAIGISRSMGALSWPMDQSGARHPRPAQRQRRTPGRAMDGSAP
ncbi:IclR family transcriptional regulator [Actinacidiphila epipremni]|jgi:DNA-binding IclR family transcriptional regulator|nr:IclR family transcriptional regulator [Actinacidiphila epipremni]